MLHVNLQIFTAFDTEEQITNIIKPTSVHITPGRNPLKFYEIRRNTKTKIPYGVF
jgi:hypothetical protein